MGCVQSYFRKAHNAGLSPSSTHGSEKAGIPQDATADVADLVDNPEKEPLEVTDIQNDGEFNSTEKPNESSPERNGTVKTDEGDAGKLIAASAGTAAVIGVAGTAAALATNDEEKKEPAEEAEVVTVSVNASVSASPAPADSEADTAEVTEDRDAKSPQSVQSGDETVVVETTSRTSGTAGEPEESGSASLSTAEYAAKSSEVSPSEPVPDDRLSTAKSEETPEQGRRPTSASQINVNEEYSGSRPTSAVVEGTRPTSASSVKEESVPEQKQDEENYTPPSGNEFTSSRPQITTEQETEPQEDGRPVSATELKKEESRPTSSTALSKETREASEKIATEATEVVQADSPPITTAEGEDTIISGAQMSEQPVDVTGSAKEDESKPQNVAEYNKEEESRSLGSEVDNTEVSEDASEIRLVSGAVSTKGECSRPVSATELTNQEGSRHASSAEDTAEVSKESAGTRPVISEGNVVAEDIKVSEEPTGSPPLNAIELETDRSKPENSAVDTTENSSVTESTKENASRPVSAAQPIKEEGNIAAENAEVSEEPTGSPPLDANELENDGNIPEISAVDTIENSGGTAGSRPVSVSEFNKDENELVSVAQSTIEEGGKPISATESTKDEGSRPSSSAIDNVEVSEEPEGSRPVSFVESNKEDESRQTSTIEIAMNEGTSVSASDFAKDEGTSPKSVAKNEALEEPANSEAVSDSNTEQGSRHVSAKEPTEEGGSSISESVKENGNKSPNSTVENVEVSEERTENQSVNVPCSISEGGSRPISAEVSAGEAPIRPRSSEVEENAPVEPEESQTSNKEGSRPESATEPTKEEIGSLSAVGTTKDDRNRSLSAAESTKEEKESRPPSAIFSTQEEGSESVSTAEQAQQEASRPVSVADAVTEEGSQSPSVIESVKDEEGRPVSAEGSTKDGKESAKEESNRPVSNVGSTEEDGSRPDNTAESTKEESRPVSLSGSTKDGGSKPPNFAADGAGCTEQSESRPVNVSGSVTEDEGLPEISATENVEIYTEQTETSPASATELTKEGSRSVNSAAVEESSAVEQAESEVEQQSEETAAEPKEDVQTAESEPVSTATEQEIVKTVSGPTSAAPSTDIQDRTEGEISTVEVADSSRPPSASRSFETGSETTKEASEQEGLSSSAAGGTFERVESPTDSVQSHIDDIPSLTVTEAADEPASDIEVDAPVEEDKQLDDEEKPETENANKEKSVEDGAEALNAAATTIQATFRGYQTRQALSKAAEKEEVPQSVTSHDFLFGPPVGAEESSVSRTPRSPETGENQQEADNEIAELQKPQMCDEIRAAQGGAFDDVSDADSSLSTAATEIQAGARGRHVHDMKTSDSRVSPSTGDSQQQSPGDTLTSQEIEDEGVHTSGSVETEVQKQHQVTIDDEISQSQEVEIQDGLPSDGQLEEKGQRTAMVRSTVSLQLDGPMNEDDRKETQTLQQDELDEAATKIQSNYRGYRMRRSLKREDAVQMPTTSTSSTTATSDVISDPIRHSGEFHDMLVLPPSPEEDATDGSAQNHVATMSSTPLQSDDDVTSAAGNQETDMTESNLGGEAKMDERLDVTAAEAATKIQASYRGFKTRQDIKTANTAASKIQAGFRGYKVRKQLRENTEEDNKNGPRSQGSRPQSANQEKEVMEATNETSAGDIEERSATKIQAGVRGYLVRKRRQAERDAAIKIQAGFRGYQARRELKARQQQLQKK